MAFRRQGTEKNKILRICPSSIPLRVAFLHRRVELLSMLDNKNGVTVIIGIQVVIERLDRQIIGLEGQTSGREIGNILGTLNVVDLEVILAEPQCPACKSTRDRSGIFREQAHQCSMVSMQVKL